MPTWGARGWPGHDDMSGSRHPLCRYLWYLWYPGAVWLLLLAPPSSAGLSPAPGPASGPAAVGAGAGVGGAAPAGPSLAGLAPMGGQGPPGGPSPAAESGPAAPMPAPPPGAAPGASQLSSRTVSTKYGDLRGVVVNLENRHLEPVEVSLPNGDYDHDCQGRVHSHPLMNFMLIAIKKVVHS